ncbi:MAG: hypothetical protein KKE23_00405 [Nanoarchaeota archaeon]|nr:hypothetical protein [Nanoarchaeota archaeon]
MAYFGGMMDFRTMAMQWSSIGMFDMILPMLLIFIIIYSVLQRTKVLTGKKEIDAIAALIISFFTIGNPEVSAFFLPLFSNVGLGIAILVAFLLIVGLVSGRPGKSFQSITLWGGIIIFLWVMSRAADYFAGYNMIFSSTWWYNNSYWLIPIIFILIVIGAVTSTPAADEAEHAKRIHLPFSKYFTEEEIK